MPISDLDMVCGEDDLWLNSIAGMARFIKEKTLSPYSIASPDEP